MRAAVPGERGGADLAVAQASVPPLRSDGRLLVGVGGRGAGSPRRRRWPGPRSASSTSASMGRAQALTAQRGPGGNDMKVATYTRISTDEDRQPFSLGAQAERLEAYAASQDGCRIVRRFSDQASGATLGRSWLKRALEEASAGVYELLLVYRVDRLSRNVRQLAQIAEDLDRVGVSLRSATEPFDTSSAAGKMMLQMLGVFAEFERTTIVERVVAGMERAASQGRWVMGRCPTGTCATRTQS